MCTHHWRQTGGLRAPFVCARCGATKQMDTIFEDIIDRRNSFNGERRPGATTIVAPHSAVFGGPSYIN